MGPVASSDKVDGRSLPVQTPTREEQVGMRKLRWKREIAHVLRHTDINTHTNHTLHT